MSETPTATMSMPNADELSAIEHNDEHFVAWEKEVSSTAVEDHRSSREASIDLFEENFTAHSGIFDSPETSHEVVRPPVFETRTLSHERELLEIIEVTNEIQLINDIADVTQHVATARSYALAA